MALRSMAPSIVTGRRRRGRSGGFTLIEVMVVMALIVTLASIGLAVYANSVTRAKESVLKEDLFRMRDAIDQYYADKNRYPTSLDELVSDLADSDEHRHRHAPFARRSVCRRDSGIGRHVEIGVGQDDHVVLGPTERLTALAAARRRLVDVLGDRRRSGGFARRASLSNLPVITVQDRPLRRA